LLVRTRRCGCIPIVVTACRQRPWYVVLCVGREVSKSADERCHKTPEHEIDLGADVSIIADAATQRRRII
jgi:hypothetical protein